MRKSSRIFVLLAVLEVLLIAGAFFMVMQVQSGAWNAPDPAEAIRRIMSVMGAAVGGIGFCLLFLGFTLRRRGD